MSFYYWDETWVGSGVGTKEQPLEGDGQKFGPASGSACLAQSRKYMFGPSNRPAHASKSPNRPSQSKHPYSIFDSGCSHSTAKRQWQFRKFTTYSHTINSKIKPNLSLLYATFSVSALEPSTAGENLGHLLFPVNGYPQTRFIYFSLISFCDFLYSVNLALEFQVHKLLEEIVNGGATDPFACFALGDWTSSQHSVSYCAGMGFASGWFSGKLKGKVKFPV